MDPFKFLSSKAGSDQGEARLQIPKSGFYLILFDGVRTGKDKSCNMTTRAGKLVRKKVRVCENYDVQKKFQFDENLMSTIFKNDLNSSPSEEFTYHQNI